MTYLPNSNSRLNVARKIDPFNTTEILYNKHFEKSNICLKYCSVPTDLMMMCKWEKESYSIPAPVENLYGFYRELLVLIAQSSSYQSFMCFENDIPVCYIEISYALHDLRSLYYETQPEDYFVRWQMDPGKESDKNLFQMILQTYLEYFYGFDSIGRIFAETKSDNIVDSNTNKWEFNLVKEYRLFDRWLKFKLYEIKTISGRGDWLNGEKKISLIDPIELMSVMRIFRQGDNKAFELFYKHYYTKLYKYANGLVKFSPEAEDIVADSFVKLWSLRKKFTEPKNIGAFLFITTRNACFNFIRRRNRNRKVKATEQFVNYDENDLTLNEITKDEMLTWLYKEMQNLPKKAKEVLELSLKEFGNAEISEKLGMLEATVRSNKRRAIKLLRGAINKKKKKKE